MVGVLTYSVIALGNHLANRPCGCVMLEALSHGRRCLLYGETLSRAAIDETLVKDATGAGLILIGDA